MRPIADHQSLRPSLPTTAAAANPGRLVGDLRVKEVMIQQPVTVSPDTALHDLRALMIEHHQRYVPVVDQGTIAGVLSFHDVARAVHEEQNFENRMLKAYINDWPAEAENAPVAAG